MARIGAASSEQPVASLQISSGAMTSVKKFREAAEAYPGRSMQAWVSAFLNKPTGLGQESFVYLGCSKRISPPGCMPWYCRKRVGTKGPLLADEHLHHFHYHEGDCSPPESGIPCFALNVVVSDYSGALNAEVWAPSMHLLGMKPSKWMVLDADAQAKHISSASKRPLEMLLMSISYRGVFSYIKVEFVKLAAYNPRNDCLGELATRFESISVVEEDEEQSICTAGIQFAPPAMDFPLIAVLKEAIGLISEADDKNAKAVSLLHEIMGHLPNP